MLYIDWQPSIEVFRIGIFSLKWYSLLWMFGLMFAYMIVKHLYKQQGIPEEKFYPQFFYCLTQGYCEISGADSRLLLERLK